MVPTSPLVIIMRYFCSCSDIYEFVVFWFVISSRSELSGCAGRMISSHLCVFEDVLKLPCAHDVKGTNVSTCTLNFIHAV